MSGFIVLIAFYIAGEAIAQTLHLPVPGSIIGLLLLLAGLAAKRGPVEEVAGAARQILRFLPLFLVPVGVAVVSLGAGSHDGLPLLVVTLIAALPAGVVVTALAMRLALRLKAR